MWDDANVPDIPIPPLHLMQRVALRPADLPEMEKEFVLGGQVRHDAICSALPDDWSFAGKSVLDFGCGPGRALRWFRAEAEECSFQACDIDAESIDWVSRNIGPPFQFFVNEEVPPLPLLDGSLDLIYSTSVFTHLTDTWGDWLAELHRLLRPDGLLFMTFLGCDNFGPRYLPESWSEDQVGLTMVAINLDARGGSAVLLSEWWIRAHLQRGFEIVHMQTEGWGKLPDRNLRGQGMLLLRRKDCSLTAEEWLAPDPGERREWISAQFNLQLLRHEILRMRAEHEGSLHQRPVGPRPLPTRIRSKLSRVVHPQ